MTENMMSFCVAQISFLLVVQWEQCVEGFSQFPKFIILFILWAQLNSFVFKIFWLLVSGLVHLN